MRDDTRLYGETAEKVFLSLLSQRGILAASFDTEGLDGVVYDMGGQLFKVGRPPFYVQIKYRGSKRDEFEPQGHDPAVVEAMKRVASDLSLPEDSLYFVVGFARNADIRTLVFFGIPLAEMGRFRPGAQFRLSVAECRKIAEQVGTIFEI